MPKVPTKVNITISIDQDIRLQILMDKPNNISELINNFLKYHYVKDNPHFKLKAELRKLKKDRTKIDEKISMIEFKFGEDKEKTSKEEEKTKKGRLEQAKQLVKGIKAAGILAED